MIKINRYLYIHFTTLCLFAVCYINRNLGMLALNYLTIFLHELAHTVSACIIGLRPQKIIFFPFGVNLKLKNNILYSLSDEIILYLSGPLFNITAAFCCLPFLKNSFVYLFYRCNLCLFLFNIIPIMPMDGAVVFKKIISRGIGIEKAEFVLKIISVLFVILLIGIEFFMYSVNGVDFSAFFMIIFLTANIFTNKEKYHMDFLKELMFFKSKNNFKVKKVRSYAIKEDTDYKKLVRRFAQGYYYIIYKENRNGEIRDILTERQIIEQLLQEKR